jgi:acyl carrier protein
MDEQTVFSKIEEIVGRLLDDKGRDAVKLTAGSELLGGEVGIDSLDLAMLVRELEEVVGFDPFADGFIEFRTAGELAKLYVR